MNSQTNQNGQGDAPSAAAVGAPTILRMSALRPRKSSIHQQETESFGRRSKTLVNFKKAQSLTTKIVKMIEADEYCIDIMQQNLALIGLMKSAHQMLMEHHLDTCFKSALLAKNKNRQKKMIAEILQVARLYNR